MTQHIAAADLAHYKSEDDIQREVATWLDRALPKDWRWYHVPNGGARSKATAGRLKAHGVKRGVFDVLGHDTASACLRATARLRRLATTASASAMSAICAKRGGKRHDEPTQTAA